MTKKEYISNAISKIELAYKVGNIPIYGQILKNYAKGYKPAKDFVKKLARMIEEGEFKAYIDVLNYLANLPPSELVPHAYSKYPKANFQI